MDTLKVGDKAPNFETKDNQGIIRKLDDYSGKKLVVFFYLKQVLQDVLLKLVISEIIIKHFNPKVTKY